MTFAAPGRSSGFSLIEVLIAMFILSIGAASVLSFYAAAASTHKRSIDRTHAALVAERVFSEVQGRYEIGKTAEELMEELDKAGMPAPGAAQARRRGRGCGERGRLAGAGAFRQGHHSLEAEGEFALGDLSHADAAAKRQERRRALTPIPPPAGGAVGAHCGRS